jgi:hypothetical protein
MWNYALRVDGDFTCLSLATSCTPHSIKWIIEDDLKRALQPLPQSEHPLTVMFIIDHYGPACATFRINMSPRHIIA